MALRRSPLKRGKGLRRGGTLKPVNTERQAKRRAKYVAYLRSPEWAKIRILILARDKHQCTMCKAKQRLEIHHKRYVRFGAENLDDLTTLCHDCHMRLEAELRPWNRGRRG